jgi:alanyl-tRNA synthetase
MKSELVRKSFLDFFASKQHTIVKSAPIVVKNDPTLMFTNAGMNQFKDLFLGNKPVVHPRIADTQKCLRVSGKHNDLEEVGIDTYHHTMFEMLGNWSFGNYFKKDSIEWAWELLTEIYKLPKDRLYVTVFGGDKNESLEVDNEAFELWKSCIAEERILYGSKKDNFWEMGDTGPCGPCSEIHVDLRSEKEIAETPGKDLVNNDHPQVIEIWNLVFIQYNRLSNGSLELLPAQHVDTGMGFERLVRAIQGKASNYDTDVFTPTINYISTASGIPYGKAEETDIAMRVLSDHIRAISFAIADGQLPSNNKAGYVIRRILRRAVRYAYTFLGFKEPFLHKLVALLANQFKDVFDELKAQEEFVAKVIFEEEQSFLKTLETGIKRFEQYLSESKNSKVVSGKFAFELYDTFGFPKDLTELLAREKGFSVDLAAFDVEMEQQKTRSRAAGSQETGDWVILKDEDQIDFIGYDVLEAEAEIVKYRQVKQKDSSYYQIVLNKTPFYAESGGQVGDTGLLISGNEKVEVINTKKENDLIVHFTKKLPSNLEGSFKTVVNQKKRKLTENNHSATHLLHAALKTVLGEHVNQKGSYVSEDILRFDFSHFTKMTDEEIRKVEKIVNEKIRENIELDEKRNVPVKQALDLGATALFGEKYGDYVRVITFDRNYSVELCGGTHVKATGNIGAFKIVSESSVSAGVRRIEAITAEKAEEFFENQIRLVNELKDILKNPADVKRALNDLLNEKNKLAKQVEAFNLEQASQLKENLLKKKQEYDGVNVIVDRVALNSADSLKQIAFELKAKVDNLFLVLAAEIDQKPQVAVMIADNLVKDRNLHAGNLVKELAKEIKGGGGGQPFYATAGGTDLTGLDNVVKKAKEIIK